MEVVAPVPPPAVAAASPEFLFFDSARTAPYLSAPSSPKLFGGGDPFDYLSHYTSAPSSPRHAAAIYAHFDDTSAADLDHDDDEDSDSDFAFEFSGPPEKGKSPTALTSADELFEKGRIRPLKPLLPPSLPRGRGPAVEEPQRSRRGSRSVSSLRGGGGGGAPPRSAAAAAPPTSTIGSILKCGQAGSKKWRLRDLLLFRSASEGRATDRERKDPLRKYTLLPTSSSSLLNRRRSGGEDSKSSSSMADGGGSVGRSRPGASAHEMHYTANRAAAAEMKKKTPLPYRQGLFGFMKLNPSVNNIARGLGGGHS